jgi:hypothetical protein
MASIYFVTRQKTGRLKPMRRPETVLVPEQRLQADAHHGRREQESVCATPDGKSIAFVRGRGERG